MVLPIANSENLQVIPYIHINEYGCLFYQKIKGSLFLKAIIVGSCH